MKKLILLILLLIPISKSVYAQNAIKDSLTREQFIHLQTAKADTLNQLALQLATPGAGSKELNEAIAYIMKGLHIYSKFRDSVGLRETFDHLGLVYHLQKKYVQAKWFLIQSNSLSRELRDTVNIIHSLVNLSSVKTDIKDYSMAQRDLKEALDLSKNTPGITLQVEAQRAYAEFYTSKGDVKKAALASNRIIFLNDSIAKLDENKKLALLKQQDQQQLAGQQLALKQKQIALEKDDSQLKKMIRQKNGITTLTTFIIAVLSVLCLFLYLKRKRKKRSHKRSS